MALLNVLLCSLLVGSSAAWRLIDYKTEPFNSPHWNIRKPGQTTDGELFLSISSPAGSRVSTGPSIFTQDGTLIWHSRVPKSDIVGSYPDYIYYNFQPVTYKNKPALSYWAGHQSGIHGYGSVYLYDHTYDLVKTICLPDDVQSQIVVPTKTPPGLCKIDKHESYYTDHNTIVVSAYNITQTDLTAVGGSANGWIYDALFFEIDLDSGDVVFSWSALDHVPITKSHLVNTTGPNPLEFHGKEVGTKLNNAWDYFHINSIQAIDGGYIASSRYTWSFYLIDGATGKVNYTVEGSNGGDFKFTDKNTFFSYQHNPRLQSSSPGKMSIHLFNNDNDQLSRGNHRNQSTGLQLGLDFKSLKATQEKDLKDPSFPIISEAEGGFQALSNGHSLVGYGTQPYIQEFDSAGNLVCRWEYFHHSKGQAKSHSYRIYKDNWTATPTTRPKVVAETHGGIIKVFMSWNGATQASGWHVYAGFTDNGKALTKVAHNVPKSGFETEYNLHHVGKYKYVRVAAVDAAGKVLKKSGLAQVLPQHH